MTEIEKMYENAGIEKKRMCEWTCKGNELCSTNCKYYENTKEFYPPFTAEKQIELIKLLGKGSSIGLDIFSDNETWFYYDYNIDGYFEYRAEGETFEEALAHIVNYLWQDLADQEKEEIRRILNENC